MVDTINGGSVKPSRRRVLQAGLVWAAGSSLAGVVTAAGSGAAARRTLVLLHLSGGNDGLNTVIPYRDPAYHDLRPRLGRVAREAIPLDGQVALHPSLRGLARMYDQGRLAIVQGVGWAEPDYSHVGSCRMWEAGITDFGLRIADFGSTSKPLSYEAGRIGKVLGAVARVAGADGMPEIVSASVGGFDTHEDQLPQHARVLRELDEALADVWGQLERRGLDDRVTVMVWSEFGRRPAENAAGGTDHGWAGPVLLVGGGIRGGLYGQMPSLTAMDGGNLVPTTDFRNLYAAVSKGRSGGWVL